MGALSLLGVLLFVISEYLVTCDSGWFGRTWQTSIVYDNSRNWDIGRIPCEGDRIVLQDTETIAVQFPDGGTSLRELVLPSFTELILPRNGLVQFTGRQKSSNCDGQDIIMKPVHPSRWIDPNNWDNWNAATPDLERVPCESDSVRFPSGATYKVIMPDYVRIGSLEVNGISMNTKDFIIAEEGARSFQTAGGFNPSVEISGFPCGPNEWCECSNKYLHSDICSGVACSTPLCQKPVHPHGFCCPICGSYFLLEKTPHDKRQLTKDINSLLINEGGVLWHASKVGKNVQVVLVERDEYTGAVTDISEKLKHFLATSGLGWTSMEFHASGHVLYPVSFSQAVGHFFYLMFAAALFLAGIVVYYSRDWTWAPFSPLEGRPFVFARFENQTDEGQVIVASEERQPADLPHAQTFDNPMYEVARQDQENVMAETSIYNELIIQSTANSIEDLTDLAH